MYAYSADYSAKTALFIDLANNVFTLRTIDASVSITCTSTGCQFGCAPASVINPKTLKPVLTCSSCVNTCTKTATASGSL